ncbi:serine/threonine-protein phosphatase 4 regulatory subunit 2-like [Hydra vulgaris]|uniref:Serine/threonine-protein phosphatase 4 regulatory subunit 2-like n=1 Tax=Hydra vulgaris TaxID=6087 RepID=A0ABM4BW80_HYDVU
MFQRDDIEEQLLYLKDFQPKETNLTILNTILEDIAKTGQYIFPWHYLKRLYLWKLQKVMSDFLETNQSLNSANKEENLNELKAIKSKLLETFDRFLSAPFTLQRLTELLLNPHKHYKSTLKYFRALEKNIFVQTTIEPVFAEDVGVKSLSHSFYEIGNLCVNGFANTQQSEAATNKSNTIEYQTPSDTICTLDESNKILNPKTEFQNDNLLVENNSNSESCKIQNHNNSLSTNDKTFDEKLDKNSALVMAENSALNESNAINLEATEQMITDKEEKASENEKD